MLQSKVFLEIEGEEVNIRYVPAQPLNRGDWIDLGEKGIFVVERLIHHVRYTPHTKQYSDKDVIVVLIKKD